MREEGSGASLRSHPGLAPITPASCHASRITSRITPLRDRSWTPLPATRYARAMSEPSTAIAHPARAGMRSVLVGVFANAVLALLKGLAGFFGNSYALIADAIESVFDIFTSILVWFGLRYASRPP